MHAKPVVTCSADTHGIPFYTIGPLTKWTNYQFAVCKPCYYCCQKQNGRCGGIRTHTVQVLSQFPLPNWSTHPIKGWKLSQCLTQTYITNLICFLSNSCHYQLFRLLWSFLYDRPPSSSTYREGIPHCRFVQLLWFNPSCGLLVSTQHFFVELNPFDSWM